MIDKVSEPDYINQTTMYLLQDHEIDTEHFLATINYSESIDELNELKMKIDQEILYTRSNDKGGQKDQEIKQTLSSLFYVRKRIEMQHAHLIKSCAKIESPKLNRNDSSKLSDKQLSNGNSKNSKQKSINSFEEEYKQYLFYSQLETLEFELVIKNEEIQHCFIEFMGKKNVQNLVSFYLNTEMYRKFAIKEIEKAKSRDDLKEVKQGLYDFAKGLINSYLLSAVNFNMPSNDPVIFL
jgi:hypothetical protein